MTTPPQPSSSSKGLLVILGVIVVCVGMALGFFLWPKITGTDSPTAAEGYVSAKGSSADGKLTSAAPSASQAEESTSQAKESEAEKAATVTEPAETASAQDDSRTDGDEVQGAGAVASDTNARGDNRGESVCDGRAVLILHSVVDYGNAQQEIDAALAQHPGTRVFQPGECSSLRASVDGHRVYAIARDYGRDIASLCRDAASQGGNPRTLNNEADFSSPCG